MSIVERLRQHALPDPHDEREVMHAPLLKEAADLIEQQAERIKELEAENAQTDNSAACGQSRSTAGLCLCDDGVRIVYEHDKPRGIRDWSGYLFFFRDIMKYEGQDERYRQEREQQQALADFLLAALQRHND